ncbi:DNA polymerase III subunit gamma/tau [Cecembia rubra]|nr:DNA polymerase III subunit gamma/tau [Cecembia rubra]
MATRKMVQEKPQPEVQQTELKKEDEKVSLNPQLAEEFDLQKLNSILQEIIFTYKEQHKNLETTVLKQPVELTGETITFKLNGEIQQDIFQKIKPEVFQLLRRKLNNYSIHLDSVIVEEVIDGKKKLYTSTDKLQYLKGKSPALIELQKRFGLETDF